MTVQTGLTHRLSAGEIIKPWLSLGPFYEDMSASVQGLTYFERRGALVGRTAMAEVVKEAQAVLLARPYEGQEVGFRGQNARWSLVRRPEKYLSWGNYYISNHLGAMFVSTQLTSGRSGPRSWRLVTRLTSQVIVALNGAIIYDTEHHPVEPVKDSFEYRFEAELQPGENTLTLGVFRLGRMARVGFYLEALEGELSAAISLPPELSPQLRTQVESELRGLRLSRDLFYPEDEIDLQLALPPALETPFTVSLFSSKGVLLNELSPTEAGKVSLGRGQALEDGVYQIACTWKDQAGQPLTATTYEIRKVTPAPCLTGYERLAERRQMALELYASQDLSGGNQPDIWRQVARYALERYDEVEEDGIRATCEFIAARKDCADFVIQGLLRLMSWEQESPRLSPQLNAMMKDTVLGFKYWVDEPGDTVMYMGSENHRLLFHVAEWLAGQLFPVEEFTNSRQRGLYHATKGRMYITEWLRQRGRFGFDEWHSNAYYPICVAPLLNVYDFAIFEDYKLHQMARAVLDYMFFNLAADSFQGIFGTTHGRSYGRYLKHPDFEGTAATCWLLYGTGSLVKGTSGMSPVLLASSNYGPPKILADIATDDQAVVESKQRHGILRGRPRHADFCVYRTPDYMISGLQDHRKGEYEPSTHVAQVTLANKVVIFWSCPQTSGEGSGLRPDYWSGHTTLPRVIQHRNVMSLTWRLSEYAWITHCFFEPARMAEVRFEGKWVFARVNQGYVGIYSENGLKWGEEGQYAGRELICEAPENTWLVECGREADWGSFEAFVQALSTATITAEEGLIRYASPSIGHFVTGWAVTPTVNDEPIQLQGYPLVDSPWAYAGFGSGELAIRYGDALYEIWFNQ